jgi:cysteinyl-tRNA synthetase
MFDRPLTIFNSDGRRLEDFVPRVAGRASLYTCGLTVYNYAHIGNLRAYVFTDTLRRALQWKGYDVLHVMNVTDVGHLVSDADEGEDKMEQAATRGGRSVWELAQFYTTHFLEDVHALGIQEPSVLCKATDHIQEMIAFARRIEANGFAYVLGDGLYFDTGRLARYGRMAMLDIEGLRAGARVTQQAGKRNVTDFVLWRRSPPGQQRLMEWSSPWGMGAPGWHLECSAMSMKYLGEHFDLHTGGIDHRQVHHPNEVAQNEGYLNHADPPSVRYWMHNEFLLLGDEKMSKSSGRFLRLQSLRDEGLHPASYRHFLLMATYRKPLEFSLEALRAAQSGLQRVLRRVEALAAQASNKEWLALWNERRASRGGVFGYLVERLAAPLADAQRVWLERLDEALSSDLNTPQALAHLNALLADPDLTPDEALRLVGIYDLVLGLELPRLRAEDLNLRPAASLVSESQIEALIGEREAARKARDFKRADAIRIQLAEAGVQLKDSRGGTTWEWAPQATQPGEQ